MKGKVEYKATFYVCSLQWQAFKKIKLEKEARIASLSVKQDGMLISHKLRLIVKTIQKQNQMWKSCSSKKL